MNATSQPAPLAVTVKEGARMLSLSYYTMRRIIKAGRIRAFRANRAHLVSVAELKRFVDESGQ